MEYNGVKIKLSGWFPLFAQGFVFSSKLCFVKYVQNPSGSHVWLQGTCETILHELDHCAKIKRLGWLNFFATIFWRYIWKGYKNTDWEKDADKEGIHWNTLVNLLEIHCKQNNLLYY